MLIMEDCTKYSGFFKSNNHRDNFPAFRTLQGFGTLAIILLNICELQKSYIVGLGKRIRFRIKKWISPDEKKSKTTVISKEKLIP